MSSKRQYFPGYAQGLPGLALKPTGRRLRSLFPPRLPFELVAGLLRTPSAASTPPPEGCAPSSPRDLRSRPAPASYAPLQSVPAVTAHAPADREPGHSADSKLRRASGRPPTSPCLSTARTGIHIKSSPGRWMERLRKLY